MLDADSIFVFDQHPEFEYRGKILLETQFKHKENRDDVEMVEKKVSQVLNNTSYTDPIVFSEVEAYQLTAINIRHATEYPQNEPRDVLADFIVVFRRFKKERLRRPIKKLKKTSKALDKRNKEISEENLTKLIIHSIEVEHMNIPQVTAKFGIPRSKVRSKLDSFMENDRNAKKKRPNTKFHEQHKEFIINYSTPLN